MDDIIGGVIEGVAACFHLGDCRFRNTADVLHPRRGYDQAVARYLGGWEMLLLGGVPITATY